MLNHLVRVEDNQKRERADIGLSLPPFARGRLTPVTGTPVSYANGTGYTTLYYTPYIGGGDEISISLAGITADLPYDVFWEAYVLSLTAWTNATTRATALTRYQGYLSKTGDLTKRYLGTIMGNATGGQLDFGDLKKHIWNNYNRVWCHMTDYVFPGAAAYQYTTTDWRQVGGLSAVGDGKVEFVLGLVEDVGHAIARPYYSHRAASQGGQDGVGCNSSTTPTGATSIEVNFYNSGNTDHRFDIPVFLNQGNLREGMNYVCAIERGYATSVWRLDNTIYANILM